MSNQIHIPRLLKLEIKPENEAIELGPLLTDRPVPAKTESVSESLELR